MLYSSVHSNDMISGKNCLISKSNSKVAGKKMKSQIQTVFVSPFLDFVFGVHLVYISFFTLQKAYKIGIFELDFFREVAGSNPVTPIFPSEMPIL